MFNALKQLLGNVYGNLSDYVGESLSLYNQRAGMASRGYLPDATPEEKQAFEDYYMSPIMGMTSSPRSLTQPLYYHATTNSAVQKIAKEGFKNIKRRGYVHLWDVPEKATDYLKSRIGSGKVLEVQPLGKIKDISEELFDKLGLENRDKFIKQISDSGFIGLRIVPNGETIIFNPQNVILKNILK